MKLFEIGEELLALSRLLDESDGEIRPENAEAMDKWFQEIGDAEAAKLDSYYGLIRSLEGEAAVAQAEADQFAKKAAARLNAAKRLKERLKLYMEMTGRTEAVMASGRKACIQKNGGKEPLEYTAEVPRDMCIIKYEPDAEKIRNCLASGSNVEFARLLPRGTHLRFR